MLVIDGNLTLEENVDQLKEEYLKQDVSFGELLDTQCEIINDPEVGFTLEVIGAAVKVIDGDELVKMLGTGGGVNYTERSGF